MPFSAIRRWHLRWFIPIEIGLLLLIAAAWWVTSRSPMARLRASGVPTTFADLAADPIPDEENAAVVLRDALPAIKKFGVGLDTFSATGPGTAYDQLDWGDRLPKGVLATAEQLTSSHSALSDVLTAISARERYVPLIDPSHLEGPAGLDEVSHWRSLARFAVLKQATQLANDDDAGAVRTAIHTLRFGNHLANEPLVVRRAVAIAIAEIGLSQVERVWRLGDLEEAQIDRLDGAIAEIKNRVPIRKTLESERVFSLRALDQLPLYTGLLYREEVLNEFEKVITISELPIDEAATAVRLLPPAKGLEPRLAPLLGAEARIVAHARCLRVAMALSTRNEAVGAEALNLPEEALIDPFTGRPLLIRTNESDAATSVASAGPDQLIGGSMPEDAEDNLVVELPPRR